MKDKVRLKSFPNGIRIVIDENAPFGDVLLEIAEKFRDSDKFFGKAKMAVTFEGRKNTREEEDAILDTIGQNCNVNIVCIASKDKNEDFERAVGAFSQYTEADSAQFYKGTLSNKKILETEQNIIVIGNVCSGSCIVSKKNIIVLGTLEGSAYAGGNGQNHFVAALHMNPESIRIGEHKGKYKAKGIWGMKKKDMPMIAYLKNDEIVFEELNFTEELLQYLS